MESKDLIREINKTFELVGKDMTDVCSRVSKLEKKHRKLAKMHGITCILTGILGYKMCKIMAEMDEKIVKLEAKLGEKCDTFVTNPCKNDANLNENVTNLNDGDDLK